jgi:hypothetical protein
VDVVRRFQWAEPSPPSKVTVLAVLSGVRVAFSRGDLYKCFSPSRIFVYMAADFASACRLKFLEQNLWLLTAASIGSTPASVSERFSSGYGI